MAAASASREGKEPRLDVRLTKHIARGLAAELTGPWASVYDNALDCARIAINQSGWARRTVGSGRGMAQ
jgi:hypothetical protein